MQRIEACLSLAAALPLFEQHGTDAVEVFHRQGQVIGVFDLDSPLPARFTETDARALEAFAARLVAGCRRIDRRSRDRSG